MWHTFTKADDVMAILQQQVTPGAGTLRKKTFLIDKMISICVSCDSGTGWRHTSCWWSLSHTNRNGFVSAVRQKSLRTEKSLQNSRRTKKSANKTKVTVRMFRQTKKLADKKVCRPMQSDNKKVRKSTCKMTWTKMKQSNHQHFGCHDQCPCCMLRMFCQWKPLSMCHLPRWSHASTLLHDETAKGLLRAHQPGAQESLDAAGVDELKGVENVASWD